MRIFKLCIFWHNLVLLDLMPSAGTCQKKIKKLLLFKPLGAMCALVNLNSRKKTKFDAPYCRATDSVPINVH